MKSKEMAKIFKALADENRLHILSNLVNGERCACELLDVIDLSQPTLSHHMKILESVNLISSQKRGKWVYYKINLEVLNYLKDSIDQLL